MLTAAVQTSAFRTRLDSPIGAVLKLWDPGQPLALPDDKLAVAMSLSSRTEVGHSRPIRSPAWTGITGERQNCWEIPRTTVRTSNPTHW